MLFSKKKNKEKEERQKQERQEWLEKKAKAEAEAKAIAESYSIYCFDDIWVYLPESLIDYYYHVSRFVFDDLTINQVCYHFNSPTYDCISEILNLIDQPVIDLEQDATLCVVLSNYHFFNRQAFQRRLFGELKNLQYSLKKESDIKFVFPLKNQTYTATI